ncbi:hypothetical protein VIGAN_04340800 [Vigna angularis var. angularis]|uniref:Uncharacterized protein n=1 Tax=Vigna angularis var. angularis TaxID=157739 RepID=A0A0S3RZ00_PHAAN|nr:hypothetical protein VIGAN_04340800 [Vigna angularis var. angularis]
MHGPPPFCYPTSSLSVTTDHSTQPASSPSPPPTSYPTSSLRHHRPCYPTSSLSVTNRPCTQPAPTLHRHRFPTQPAPSSSLSSLFFRKLHSETCDNLLQ